MTLPEPIHHWYLELLKDLPSHPKKRELNIRALNPSIFCSRHSETFFKTFFLVQITAQTNKKCTYIANSWTRSTYLVLTDGYWAPINATSNGVLNDGKSMFNLKFGRWTPWPSYITPSHYWSFIANTGTNSRQTNWFYIICEDQFWGQLN